MSITMTPEDIAFHLKWRAYSGHPGGWRVCRQDFRPDQSRHLQELKTRRGAPVLFKTYESATRRANAMNAAT